MTQILLGDLSVEVTFKDIKNVHLSVHPPAGRVSVAAPERMSIDTIRLFAILKLDWIKRQQKKLAAQLREGTLGYLNQESHYLWGKRYLLRVSEHDRPPSVEVQHSQLHLIVRPETSTAKKQEIVSRWYRSTLKTEAAQLVSSWAPRIGVSVDTIFVRKMKTKWGSCNPTSGSIRLNSDLAKKPKDCVEYVVVHELIHLIEPTHNARFHRLMNRFMPNWQTLRDQLNELPVAYADAKR